jgi:REP element-mobilizing transposase RayT
MPFRTFHHRTPQKRYYIEGAKHFITSVTHDRYPFFSLPHFSQVFVEDLRFACELKELELFGYAVMPDHVHLLFQPLGRWSYSDVVGSLKRNTTRDINDLISGQPFVRDLYNPHEGDSHTEGNDSNRSLLDRRLLDNFQITKQHHPHLTFDTYKNHFDCLESVRRTFEAIETSAIDAPSFRWQKSFRDHIIRDQRDIDNHIDYIYSNAVKHELTNAPRLWPWMWVVGMPPPPRHH